MEPNIAAIAGLIGEPARANMLMALMGGKALTATELAMVADITSQTASSHLSKLVTGQLLKVRKQGRHKYFQLQGVAVADLLEQLLNVSSASSLQQVTTGPADPRLRKARICYDHLAGELAVELYRALLRHEFIIEADNEPRLTSSGQTFFSDLGLDFSQLNSRRPACKSCLDWSERRSHLAGTIGQWIMNDIFHRGWAAQDLDSRIIQFSDKGLQRFSQTYQLAR